MIVLLHTLKNKKQVSLSQLTRVFSKRPLLLALERLVEAGKVACRFDGRDYFYRTV